MVPNLLADSVILSGRASQLTLPVTMSSMLRSYVESCHSNNGSEGNSEGE